MADPPLSWAPCLVFWVMVLRAWSWEPSCALTIAVHFKTPPIPEAPLAQGAFPSLLWGLQNALLVLSLSLCACGFFSFFFLGGCLLPAFFSPFLFPLRTQRQSLNPFRLPISYHSEVFSVSAELDLCGAETGLRRLSAILDAVCV